MNVRGKDILARDQFAVRNFKSSSCSCSFRDSSIPSGMRELSLVRRWLTE